ncbi:MAG: hypothetical protein R6X02_13980 [Enhygromyxa sp.]
MIRSIELVLGCSLVLACMPRQSGEQAEVTPGSEESAELGRRCEAALPNAIGTLAPSSSGASSSCGATLELDGSQAGAQLTIRSIPYQGEGVASVGEVLASGPIPAACGEALERCELWGVHDELGPVLLATVRGPESEIPVQVYVGWTDEGRLGFAPSWYGLPSIVDHTRVGPPWALAPFDCDGRLTLLPSARLPEAAVEDPSEAVLTAAGRWTIADDGNAAPREAAVNDPADCRPVFATLP